MSAAEVKHGHGVGTPSTALSIPLSTYGFVVNRSHIHAAHSPELIFSIIVAKLPHTVKVGGLVQPRCFAITKAITCEPLP